jgi:hypothetical protein
VEDSESATVIGLNTAQIQIDIPESANWEDAYSTVNNNSGDWQSAADELAVLNTAKWEGAADTLSSHSADWNNKLDADIYAEDSGTFLTALPADLATTGWVTGQGYLTAETDWTNTITAASANAYSEATAQIPTDYATTAQLTAKLDTTAFSTVSGNFLTAHQSLADYQTTAGMTAYQPVGDYLTTGDSSNFYTTANESGFITGVDLTDYATKDFVNDNVASSISGKLDIATYSSESANFLTAHQSLTASANWNSTYDTVSNNSASWTGGATPTYEYTDNGLISAIDSSGLYAESSTSALIAVSTNHLNNNGTMGGNIIQSKDSNNFYYMPLTSPFGKPTGIFSPLQYATGACLAMAGGGYAAYFKGNEWYVSNTGIGQALRGEVHNSRSVHISGATTAGYGFDLNIKAVSGVNSTGSWKYGHAEDAALRAVSSCDMHESAFGYDASNNITAYNGSAFKAGDEFPQSATEAIEVVTGGSANWNSTTATVATNSGAWGGQGIELSAGFGIDIQLVDNKLVISLATATGDI